MKFPAPRCHSSKASFRCTARRWTAREVLGDEFSEGKNYGAMKMMGLFWGGGGIETCVDFCIFYMNGSSF